MENAVKDIQPKTSQPSKLNRFFDFDIKLAASKVVSLLPFVIFIAFLIILYIANEYYSQKTILEINKLNKDLKELRAESLTIKAELMNSTKLTEIEKMTGGIGLKNPQEPARRITDTQIER